jgi:WD40 repeat protein
MNIKLDWQIADQERPSEELPPSAKPRPERRLWRIRAVWIALVALAMLLAAGGVIAWLYHTRLNQATPEIQLVARSEAWAETANDLDSYLALQDPEDSAWRAVQEKRFGQLERVGLTEFGWKATRNAPQPGSVTLEPGGARLDVTYRFSVTQPMPGGPVSVTLRVPQYYKQTPSGWVHALPGPDFWGAQRKQQGKRVIVIYFQRDASLIEPLAPRLDGIMQRICDALPCPWLLPVTFENTADSLANLSDFSYGYDDTGLKLPSPHLIGLPADVPSREELYRAYETRLVQALVFEASGRRLNMNYLSSEEFVRWELAQVGLTGPFINEAITRTLLTAPAVVRQPVSTISFRTTSGLDASPGEAVLPLAYDFLEQQLGAGSVTRLLPALASSRVGTLGEAISLTLHVNPTLLELAWQRYLQERTRPDLQPSVRPSPPDGELVLECSTDGTFLWRIRTDGTGLARISPQIAMSWAPVWSPDGKLLAYTQEARVVVIDPDSHQVKAAVPVSQASYGWLPDGRLWVQANYRRTDSYASIEIRDLNLPTLRDIKLANAGRNSIVLSPDGTRMAYSAYDGSRLNVWMADANGYNAQQIAPGFEPAWSPDSTRLAFLTDFQTDSDSLLPAGEIQILNVSRGAVTTLARGGDLPTWVDNSPDILQIGELTWSPDGSLLSVTNNQSNGSVLVTLGADDGEVRARWVGANVRWAGSVWSPDSRHVALMVMPSIRERLRMLDILNVVTGQAVTLPGYGFDWSPDGQWLAVTQDGGGVLLVTPDLSAMSGLDTPECSSVAWRPKR